MRRLTRFIALAAAAAVIGLAVRGVAPDVARYVKLRRM